MFELHVILCVLYQWQQRIQYLEIVSNNAKYQIKQNEKYSEIKKNITIM